MTISDEIMHARLKDSAVLFVAEIVMNEVLKRITKNIIRITCSKNSVMLIAKNFFSPQSAPRSTSYIAEKNRAGNKI